MNIYQNPKIDILHLAFTARIMTTSDDDITGDYGGEWGDGNDLIPTNDLATVNDLETN